ncbi:3-hydroxyisobutyrate dehydrogenase [Shimia abyssi]|uniref:3-hydroxyisobutyrate dehydrogenase n=1 Tax=Shimia abyssi TaxID=1662395 RepID=A0A2P8FBD0_9RHOB|nr:3-hydroxyisobutyrate dehydrogenase [Shimia abyssi]PSL18972.1 3-hydroxyisobutyrate dehydrogenase [Shimia abyssi]
MSRIVFIGLGTMGLHMARGLAAAGHDVVGMDINAEARAAFPGATALDKTKMGGADIIITMLPEGAHVAQVHDEFLFSGVDVGTLLIDCSTIDVGTARALAASVEAKGSAMLDAPVSGGPAGAEAGTLSFMVGGNEDAFERARPVLEVMGSTITHFGAAGSGQAAKACHNMICGITAIAVTEGFALADSLSLDLNKFYGLCAGAAAQSWALENRCPIPGIVPAAPSSSGFAPGFASALMAKDLRLAQAAAQETGQVTPFGAEAARAFTSFAEEHGQLDFSAIYQTLRALPDQ